jgi:ribosomal protein S28E/S33
MEDLGIGVRVVVTDRRTLGAVWIAHVPGPVRPDDLIAFGEGIRGVCSRSFRRLPARHYACSPIRLR